MAHIHTSVRTCPYLPNSVFIFLNLIIILIIYLPTVLCVPISLCVCNINTCSFLLSSKYNKKYYRIPAQSDTHLTDVSSFRQHLTYLYRFKSSLVICQCELLIHTIEYAAQCKTNFTRTEHEIRNHNSNRKKFSGSG